MTPAEHKTEAERLLSRHAEGSGPVAAGYAAVMHAHAALSQAIGTGEHYDAADTILATISPQTAPNTSARRGEQALAHALLADR